MKSKKKVVKAAKGQFATADAKLNEILKQERAEAKAMSALWKLEKAKRKKSSEWLVAQGLKESKEEKSRRLAAKKKIIGDPSSTVSERYPEAQRTDLSAVPRQELAELGLVVDPPCRCGEIELYLQPPWCAEIGLRGPFLTWHRAGDGQDAIGDWDDAPPDFEWLVYPQEGEATTASLKVTDMYMQGGDDGWNYATVSVYPQAIWDPQGPGRFRAHMHFGGSDGPDNGLAHGDGAIFWPDESRFQAWLYLHVSHWEPSRSQWVTLYEHTVRVANHTENNDVNHIGESPYYWKLDHWLASPELNIPAGKRVSIMGGARFKISAEGDEAGAGINFDERCPLLFRPVITGIQCGVIE